MKTTCALAVMHGGSILIVLPTNGRYKHGWSLPKGIMDEGETCSQAATRECFEETGYDFRTREAELVNLGLHAYRKDKNYHLSLIRVQEPIDPMLCVCTSMFTYNGGLLPEVSQFAFVPLDVAIREYLNNGQSRLIESLRPLLA